VFSSNIRFNDSAMAGDEEQQLDLTSAEQLSQCGVTNQLEHVGERILGTHISIHHYMN